MHRILSLLFLLVLFAIASGKSENIDSLWRVYDKAVHDTLKIKILNDEIGSYYQKNNPDSAIICYQMAYDMASKALEKTSKKDVREALEMEKILANAYLGVVNYETGNSEKSLKYLSLAVKNSRDLLKTISNKYQGKIKVIIARSLNQIGMSYKELGKYDKAIETYQKSIKEAEKINDKLIISDVRSNIGLLHLDMGEVMKAIEYFEFAIKIKESIKDMPGLSNCYINMGIAHLRISYNDDGKLSEEGVRKEQDLALDFFKKSIEIAEKVGMQSNISSLYVNMGIVYGSRNEFEKSEEYFLKALNLNIEIDFKDGIAACYGNLAALSQIMAESVALTEGQKKKYLEKTINYGLQCMKYAKEINSLERQIFACSTLKTAYASVNNYKEALFYANEYLELNKKIFSEDKTKAIADAEKKFETEKNKLLIDKLNKEKQLQDSQLKLEQEASEQQRLINYFIIAGLILISLFAFFIVQRLRITRKQKKVIEVQKAVVDEKNVILNQQNEEIRAQRDEIEAQRDEITAQRDLVTNQKERIEVQKKEITDSIVYAKYIQTAVLPTGDYAKDILGEHFIYFNPKDIVSGDFYWATKVDKWLVFTVADCTGHGVPGAFMSMLGVSFLNEIVREKEVTRANEILDRLRMKIIDALKQKSLGETDNGSKKAVSRMRDGMDIAVCVLNIDSLQLQFSGANNGLFVVKTDKSVFDIPGDKQPVAIYEKMVPFTNHVLDLQTGDTIYLNTDGFTDQFGGAENKKFMTKRMKEMFKEISSRPMSEQLVFVNSTFENWKGIRDQIDDVTVLGIRI